VYVCIYTQFINYKFIINFISLFRQKFNTDIQTNCSNGKSNFKESMKTSRTHLGFGGDGKYKCFTNSILYLVL